MLRSCGPGTKEAVRGQDQYRVGCSCLGKKLLGQVGGTFSESIKASRNIPLKKKQQDKEKHMLKFVLWLFSTSKTLDGFSLLSISYCFASLKMVPEGTEMNMLPWRCSVTFSSYCLLSKMDPAVKPQVFMKP